MNIFHALPLILACAMAVPAIASDRKDFYAPPETMGKQLFLNSHTEKTVTFRFDVMPLIGEATDIKLSAKVVGDQTLVPTPKVATFTKLVEGQSATLDFVLPITKEQAQNRKLKIQGTVEYLPDYEKMLTVVQEDAQNQYPNKLGKNKLIYTIKDAQTKKLRSTEIIRFDPTDVKTK